jgi:hypothetical protein
LITQDSIALFEGGGRTMSQAKITIEEIDIFEDGEHRPNEFKKYKVLNEISVLDKFMDYHPPGEYKITISIEKV